MSKLFLQSLGKTLFIILLGLIIALSLISFGWLMAGYNDSIMIIKVVWNRIIEIATVASGAGTAVAAWAASQALTTWKDKFLYEKKYEAFVHSEKSFNDFLNAYYKYKDAYLWSLRIKNNTHTSLNIKRKAEQVEILEDSWVLALQDCLSSCESAFHILDNDIESIKDKISRLNEAMELVFRAAASDNYSLSYNKSNGTIFYRTEHIKQVNGLILTVKDSFNELRCEIAS